MKLEEFFRDPALGALTVLTVIAGALTGLVLAYQASFTSFAIEVDALAEYPVPLITTVYADDGKTKIGELSLERRIPIEYQQIPERLKQAILSIEDTRFYQHIGVDPVRILGATVQNVLLRRRAQGASTLTQQLARDLYLTREKTYTRKLKEIMYALQIERVYTKEQILTLYCNQIFLGGGAYGFQAAAKYYFSKEIKDLTLDQYALLAALPKGPQQFSPVYKAKAAKDRRNLVLQAMADAGYITTAEAETAKNKSLGTVLDDPRGKNDRSPYAYFVEEVRQELQRIMVSDKHQQDASAVYKDGLSVYTTLDPQAQQWAVDAVRSGANAYEKRHGWKVGFYNVIAKENVGLEGYRHPSWISVPQPGDIVTGLITDVNERATYASFGGYSSLLTAEQTKVLGKPPARLFRRGDLAQFRVLERDENRKVLKVRLEPEPDVQAALILVDVKSGEIKAMVGGYNFATSKFNHATQANRQTGSIFKPFVYASALEQGLKPDDIVDDSPFRQGAWEPHNYDNTFMGPIPIRQALALSRNIPAVRVLDEIGVRNAADLSKRMGLPNAMAPYLPSALGATEEPLLPLVSAYAAFANNGVRVEPTRIRKIVDRYGNVLDQAEPKSYKVLSDYIAAQMVDMMRGVVQFGTARAAVSQGHPLAGKTGTVNESTDAWFLGYTPTVACGVWIGYSDQKRPLGKGETGASAALPFWNEFMSKYLKDKPKGKFSPIPELPDDLRQIQIVRQREHQQELAKLAIRSGEILPGSDDVPNLDPLEGTTLSPENKTPTPSRPAPPPIVDEPLPTTRVDQNTKVVRSQPEAKPVRQEEPARKGKKGKNEDP
ncbi:MAG TPA: PBP1A family penicillin-binding protein [Blastocatellia bacterium]|nr:PBP1A family penicillin-binding protein [Blastocatellia bacterium]